ncbi:topless-related 4-like isoform X1 [Olea europaea subsp. europaea]|uniref:Topless-related 4-like isoform X1 n=1 Tax=Olea europaea subsp. europaea TaxID=158383 RepID=A0A8S0P938_OLEEU|nr:topless-related 4-like isoform X1 [Olea europaea subsp. europaea]
MKGKSGELLTIYVISAFSFSQRKMPISSASACSLKWQHHLSKNLNLKPDKLTLFADHICVTDQLLGRVNATTPSSIEDRVSPATSTLSMVSCFQTFKKDISVPMLSILSGNGQKVTVTRQGRQEQILCLNYGNLNDAYVILASGGKISLYNIFTFKTMATFNPPPPAATFLAFHPQDSNIIAIGMNDSSIQIYNVKLDEEPDSLVRSSTDPFLFNQLCVWIIDTWEKQASEYLQSSPGCSAASLADTHVQFHCNQTHLLAFQERQIAVYEVPNLTCLVQCIGLSLSYCCSPLQA